MGRHPQASCVISIGLAVLLAASAAYAQNEETDSAQFELAAEPFFERLDEFGRVRGDIVMGVMIGAVPTDPDADAALADGPGRPSADIRVLRLPSSAPDERFFCVRINSKDGRFEAENTYRLLDAGIIVPDDPFPYEGGEEKALNAMHAVSLVKVGRCGDRTEEVVPSAWQGTVLPPNNPALHVFVNSAGNPTIAVVGSDPGFTACQDVSDQSALKYTASCVLPFEALAAEAQDGRVPVTFYVTRSMGEESFEISVILPDLDG